MLPIHKACVFPWYAAISSSNKKPASLEQGKLISPPANYTEAPGRTGKTRGTSPTGHHSHTLTHNLALQVQWKHTCLLMLIRLLRPWPWHRGVSSLRFFSGLFSYSVVLGCIIGTNGKGSDTVSFRRLLQVERSWQLVSNFCSEW